MPTPSTYHYVKANADMGQLYSEVLAAGLPCDYVDGTSAYVDVHTPDVLSPPQITTLNGVVAAHVAAGYDWEGLTGHGGGGDTFVGGLCVEFGLPTVQMSIAVDAAGLKLGNDVANPGPYKAYSTDDTGVKGWRVMSGRILGVCQVATDQSTTSGAATGIGTPDEVTFSLDAPGTVLALWNANIYNSTAGLNNRDQMFYNDGAGFVADSAVMDVATGPANAAVTMVMTRLITFASAGSKSIKVQHAAISGGVAHWRNRTLILILKG